MNPHTTASVSVVAETERWFAHYAAGCVASVADLGLKQQLTRDAHAAIERVASLRPDGMAMSSNARPPESLAALYRTREVEILDAFVALDPVDRSVLEAGPRLHEAGWLSRLCAEDAIAPSTLWPARVARPRRPETVPVGAPGEPREEPADPYTQPEDIAIMLHSELNAEYTTMELMARCSFEFPGLPFAHHRRLLRQAADEANHASLVDAEIQRWGMSYGDVPVSTSGFELNYSWPDIQPGSLHELLNRLLLRSSIQEALSLDHLEWQIRVRDRLGQPTLARMYDQILHDEIHHVKSGFFLAEELAGQVGVDLFAERAAARERNIEAATARQMQWLGSHWQESLAQAMPSAATAPIPRSVNFEGRARAGFPSAALAQDLEWEYAL